MNSADVEPSSSKRRRVLEASALVLIVIAATVLRAWQLGRLSFWYDEVVTMRLAETPSIGALFKLLFQIDATRAPLHPLILQDWLAVFGTSEIAGRALSVGFGVATVVLLYGLGRLMFDRSTGVWAAFLGAFSPLLVYYSREVRMYALLTMLTTLCWVMLYWGRRTPARWKAIGYVACLIAMLFTHPLGLLMLGTLALASALDVRAFFGSWKAWLAVHLGALIVTAPWLRFYFDHAPEFLSGRLPIKFLLATPIGFVGGDSTVYFVIVALIAFGLYRRGVADRTTREWVAPACLALWLVLPPTILFAYSWIASPIFGPARYTLFCAPAYLVLIAQALSRIPALSRWTLGLGLACVAVVSMRTIVYDPQLKADWRSFSEALAFFQAQPPRVKITVMLASDVEPNVEMVTARYYLERTCPIAPFDEGELEALRKLPRQEVYLLVGGGPSREISPSLQERLQPFVTGVDQHRIGPLRFYRLAAASLQLPARAPAPAPEPAEPARPAPD
ncbi:MAG: glycosyltransferase family 39 protein [Paludisphaera borealis]|uniref:glycosyltransferase family 39 protein n=1 Tax=Paludisphaera borealis TaxID=1387353 RepID=UPI00284AEDE6|nr:glycosyltransferase family 39 protein [Paludisphaera borealis]MDR3619739.1 glycosyltransferase family 39 protein [Paludisphaera borealis]